MHRIIEVPEKTDRELDTIAPERLLAALNRACNRSIDPENDNVGFLEFLAARQYLPLLDHAEDVFKHYHELLDFAEGTAVDNRGRPWDWIEKAKAVVSSAEGNT